jgi:hypothetical protein
LTKISWDRSWDRRCNHEEEINMDKEKFIGDEFEEITDEITDQEDKEDLEKLFDLVLPPGMSYRIIMEVIDKFNLEITTRKVALKTVDVDNENLLVLRGRLEDVNNAHDYIYQKLSEKYNYKR